MKKILCVMLGVIMAATALLSAANAVDVDFGYRTGEYFVNVESVNVRSETAVRDDTFKKVVFRNAECVVTEFRKQTLADSSVIIWGYAGFEDVTGWIMMKFLTLSVAIDIQDNSSLYTVNEADKFRIVPSTVGELNENKPLLSVGSIFVCEKQYGGWGYGSVTDAAGEKEYGWYILSKATLVPPADSQTQTDTEEPTTKTPVTQPVAEPVVKSAGIYSVTAEGAEIRLSAASDAFVLGTAPKDTKLEVTEIVEGFGYVKYADVRGWVALDSVRMLETRTYNNTLIDICRLPTETNTYNWIGLERAGVGGVLLRIGNRSAGIGISIIADSGFSEFYSAAEAAGLGKGVYFYSCATDVETAVADAMWVTDKLDTLGVLPEYPVYYKTELDIQKQLGAEALDKVLRAFCSNVEDKGYEAGICCPEAWMGDSVKADIAMDYSVWLLGDGKDYCEYQGEYNIWQADGKISGDGTNGDYGVNICYTKYPAKHMFVNWTVTAEPDCTHYGSKTSKCKSCEAVKTVTVPPLGHSAENTWEAAPASDGFGDGMMMKCSVCGETVAWRLIQQPDDTHFPENEWLSSEENSCEENTMMLYCAEDGCNEVLMYMNKKTTLGHTPKVQPSYLAPTCTEKGYERTECSVCGEIIEETLFPALGHSISQWEVLSEATYTHAGKRTGYCTVCNKTVEEILPILEYLLGDADLNCKINAADARLVLRVAAGLASIAEESVQFKNADYNGDGKIRTSDARMILRKSAGFRD